MDCGAEYIKMCQKAEGIQKNPLQYHSGDYVYHREKAKTVVLYYSKYHGNPPLKYLDNKLSVWLPRQDQLQEMVEKFKKGKNIDLYWMMKALHDFQVIHTGDSGITSMEQLWLAFVMFERYKKTWNGENWK